MDKLLYLALSLCILSSCHSGYYYKPFQVKEPEQQITWQHGIGTIRQESNFITLTAGLIRRQGSDLIALIEITNNSDSLLHFFPDEVTAVGYNEFKKQKPLRVMTADQVIKRRNRNMAIATVAVLGAGATAIALDRNSPSANENSNWGAPFWFWYPSSVVMYAPQQGVFNQTRDGLLRTHTLEPGETMQGEIRIRNPRDYMQKVDLGVNLDGTIHQFQFSGRERMFR